MCIRNILLMIIRAVQPTIRMKANWKTGHRVVSDIYLDQDPRPSRARPLAADVFLSFWHKELGYPIEALQTLFFDTVQEISMDRELPTIYGLLRRDPSQPLSLRRESHGHKQEAFQITYCGTRFGRCARTIETQNKSMKDARIKVLRFKFDVHQPNPSQPQFKYNFIVTFGISGPE